MSSFQRVDSQSESIWL